MKANDLVNLFGGVALGSVALIACGEAGDTASAAGGGDGLGLAYFERYLECPTESSLEVALEGYPALLTVESCYEGLCHPAPDYLLSDDATLLIWCETTGGQMRLRGLW